MASPERSRSNRKRGIEEGSDGKNGKGMDDVDHEERRKHKSRKSRKSSHGKEVEYETRKEAYSDKLKQEENVKGMDDVDHEGHERRNKSRKSRKSSHGEEVKYEKRKETCSDKLKMKQEENVKGMDDVDHEGDERRKHNSRKSRKSSHGEKVEYETRKEAYSDKLKMKQEENVKGMDDVDHEGYERRKHKSRKSRKSSHGEEVKYEERKETCSDKLKMKQEEGTLEKLSNRYGDIDLESKQDGADKSGGRAHTRLDDEKSITTDTGGSLGKSNKDSRFSVKSGNTPVKLHGSSEHGIRRSEHKEKSSADRTDSRSGKSLDLKNESVRERSSLRDEICKGKQKALESSEEKDKSYSREERRADTDRTKRRSRTPEKSRSGIGDSRRSRTPEKSGKYLYESYISDMDHDRSSSLKKEELDKEAYEDDRNKDRDGSKDHGKQVQLSSNDGDGVVDLDRDREWERPNRIRSRGRDYQQVNMPVHLMVPPFSPLSMPPSGPIEQLNPAMFNQYGPINPLQPPGHRFESILGTPRPALIIDSRFNAMIPAGRGQSHDTAWVPPKSNVPPGKAPSRGEQNDYSQNFVDTGKRPQNFISDPELAIVEDYPKLRELIQKKDEIVVKASTAPMYHKCDLQEFVLSPDFFGTKFDVILVDPPWEEYVHRAPGVTDGMESWTCEEIMNLKIEAIADTPSFIFLWVGDGVGLEHGRQCLKKWGFRRCEDICWVKTNRDTATPGLRHDSATLFQRTKEHCLMGIKGKVRRNTDGHIIHANIDTDIIVADEPPYGSTAKPDEIYRIIEHFSLGSRRLELFGEDHNIRRGWVTLGKGLSSSNFDSEAYIRNFTDKDGKVWQGREGRLPPPQAPHLVQTTPEIEALRPK